MFISRFIRGGAACVALAAGAFAQSAPKPLQFEVATFKPHPPGDVNSSTRIVDGGVDATNVTLRQLIVRAYDLQDYQLVGSMPGWVSEQRWDMQARTSAFVMPENPNALSDAQRQSVAEQMQERLRNLLAERFQLVTRAEMKDQQIYVLLVAKNGPKLQPAKVADANNSVNTNMNNGRGVSTFTASSMATLVQQLGRRSGRPVLDKTGIEGKYDFKLEWSVDAEQAGGLATTPAATNLAEPTGPTIFTALQEQLGLRLESQRGPVKVLTIERVEQPSEN